MAANARVQQGILRAAGTAYMALDIPPPDSHVIDVLMSIPGLEYHDAETGDKPTTSAGIGEATLSQSSHEASAETTDTRQTQTALRRVSR